MNAALSNVCRDHKDLQGFQDKWWVNKHTRLTYITEHFKLQKILYYDFLSSNNWLNGGGEAMHGWEFDQQKTKKYQLCESTWLWIWKAILLFHSAVRTVSIRCEKDWNSTTIHFLGWTHLVLVRRLELFHSLSNYDIVIHVSHGCVSYSEILCNRPTVVNMKRLRTDSALLFSC